MKNSDDIDSDESFINHIKPTYNQYQVNKQHNYNQFQKRQNNDPNQLFNIPKQQFSGFSTAKQHFKLQLNKQQNHLPSFEIKQIKQQSQSQSQSTQTITSSQKLKSKDTKLNKQLQNIQFQKPKIKDIQDLGQRGGCGGCGGSGVKKSGGLNYKDRNKRLINQFNQRQDKRKNSIYQTQSKQFYPNQNQSFHLNQFQYERNKNQSNMPIGNNKDNNQPNLLNSTSVHKTTRFNYLIDNTKVSNQQKLKIQNIDVYFPYKPYDAQINYMQHVIKCLNNKQHNAILQSPTGTGKTLCLLSAAFSWVNHRYNTTYQQISIIYLSRTHSQLAQVLKELQKTCFRPTMSTFGSRQINCIKDQFKQFKGRDKVQACNKAVKLYLKYGRQQRQRGQLMGDADDQEHILGANEQISPKKQFQKLSYEDQKKVQDTMCSYYASERYVLDLARNKFKNKIITNEKIKQLAKQYNFCPYYYPMFIKPICNLFLMPYNYILDCDLNQRYKQIIHNSILIFDEAHNVPESACQGKSFGVVRKTFDDAKKQLQRLMDGKKMSEQLFMVREKYQFRLKQFQQQIDRIQRRINSFIEQVQFTGMQKNSQDDSVIQKYMFNEHQTQQKVYQLIYEPCYDHQRKLFQNQPKSQVTRNVINKMSAQIFPIIDGITQLCQQLKQTPDGLFQNIQKVSGFAKKCLRLLLQNPNNFNWKQRQVNHFRLMVQKREKNWQITLTCLVPFLAFKTISSMSPRNIILTSGTLSPLDTWQNQLDLKFQVRLCNTHVIKPQQIMLRVLISQDTNQFNFSYKYINQNFKTIYQSTVNAIIKLAQRIPNGILIILPSYKILSGIERCLQFKSDLKKKLSNAKKYFVETKDGYEQLIKKYRKAAMESKGALLFCVCRGKISQGIDFPNQLCRAVIFIGIPFPNVQDIVIKQKKKHYDTLARNDPQYKFSGQKWYENLSFRSVNQAIGRVIRHIYDFGTIFLLDLRYNYPKYRSQLPKWTLNSYKQDDLTDDLLDQVSQFYVNMEKRFGNYEGKNQTNRNKQISFDDQNQEKAEKVEIDRFSQNNNNRNNFLSKKAPSGFNPMKNNNFLINDKYGSFMDKPRLPSQDLYRKQQEKQQLKQKKAKNAFELMMGNSNKGAKKNNFLKKKNPDFL